MGHAEETKRAAKHTIEVAAKRSDEYEGDRRGIRYVGWENEPEKVREDWRASVRVPITAYLTHFGAPVDYHEDGATNTQPALATMQGGQSSDGVAEGSKLYASPAYPALGCQVSRNGKLAPIAKPVAGVESRPSEANEPTPAPWAYEYIGNLLPGRTRSDRSTIAIVGDFRVVREGRGYDLHSSDEDDAHLIAAAHDLLAALKFSDALRVGDIEGMIALGWSLEGYETGEEYAVRISREAIAKVNGGSA